MAEDRLEECLQAVAGRKDSGTVERGRGTVNSVDLTPLLLFSLLKGKEKGRYGLQIVTFRALKDVLGGWGKIN
jgi:hypothetical protein